MLGGLYPGLYGLTTGVGGGLPVGQPYEEVTSTETKTRLLVMASAIDCRSLVTSLFIEQTSGEVPSTHAGKTKPGVRVLVTGSTVRGKKR